MIHSVINLQHHSYIWYCCNVEVYIKLKEAIVNEGSGRDHGTSGTRGCTYVAYIYIAHRMHVLRRMSSEKWKTVGSKNRSHSNKRDALSKSTKTSKTRMEALFLVCNWRSKLYIIAIYLEGGSKVTNYVMPTSMQFISCVVVVAQAVFRSLAVSSLSLDHSAMITRRQ